MILTGEIEVQGEKPVQMTLCPPQISHGLLGQNVNLSGESSATDSLTHVMANVSI